MKRNYAGCAICDSTWGDTWAEIDGERVFFCCDLCVRQFRGLLEHIRTATGWSGIDSIEIAGDRRGRTCAARRGTAAGRFQVSFNSDGDVLRFVRLEGTSPAAG